MSSRISSNLVLASCAWCFDRACYIVRQLNRTGDTSNLYTCSSNWKSHAKFVEKRGSQYLVWYHQLNPPIPQVILPRVVGDGEWWWECNHVMHGRSRMIIDPRIPTIPGRGTSGFYRPGRHRVNQARSTVRCLVSHLQGELLYSTKNQLVGGGGCWEHSIVKNGIVSSLFM